MSSDRLVRTASCIYVSLLDFLSSLKQATRRSESIFSSSPTRTGGPLPHPRRTSTSTCVHPGRGAGAPVGTSSSRGVGRRDRASPHRDDALGLLVNVVDCGGLLAGEVV